MSKSEKQKAESRRQKAEDRKQYGMLRSLLPIPDCRLPAAYCLLLSAFCLLFSGCRQDMQDQPRYEAYEASGFFKNGMASRPLVEGTIPRGFLRADKQLFTGQMNSAQGSNVNASPTNGQNSNAPGSNSNAQGNTQGTSVGANGNGNANLPMSVVNTEQNSNARSQPPATISGQAPAGDANDAVDFPFPVTQEVMDRGQERYQIFCAMCHGYTGDGDGMIVRRGFRQPPSYHEERLRQARVGYFFRVMTEGFGAMPSYRVQIPVQDRWAIIAYIRALQMSKMNQPAAQPRTAPTVASTGAVNSQSGGQR